MSHTALYFPKTVSPSKRTGNGRRSKYSLSKRSNIARDSSTWASASITSITDSFRQLQTPLNTRSKQNLSSPYEEVPALRIKDLPIGSCVGEGQRAFGDLLG